MPWNPRLYGFHADEKKIREWRLLYIMQRKCTACGHIENESTYFCTVCGAKTEEYDNGFVEIIKPEIEQQNYITEPENNDDIRLDSHVTINNKRKQINGSHTLNICMICIAIVSVFVMVLTLFGVIPSINKVSTDEVTKVEENETDLTMSLSSESSTEEVKNEIADKKVSLSVEGEGFESPEECLSAYIEALNSGNIDEVISTFAIESYVDNFDTRAHIERLTAFVPNSPFIMDYELSDGSNFDRDIRIKVRQAYIIRSYYNMISQQTVQHDGQTIGPLEGQEVDEFMNRISESDFLNAWENMKFVKFVSPDELCDVYYSEQNQRNIELQTAPYHCEEVSNICALVEINDEDYYQFAECGKYDGKWYIISCTGNLASILGVSIDYYGLVPCSYIEE